MFSEPPNNQTPEPAKAVQNYPFDGLVSTEFDGGTAQAAIKLLQELVEAQNFEINRLQQTQPHEEIGEYIGPLEKLPPSEWRSLGGYFDYCNWADRDRFMELDRAIALQRSQMYEMASGDDAN